MALNSLQVKLSLRFFLIKNSDAINSGTFKFISMIDLYLINLVTGWRMGDTEGGEEAGGREKQQFISLVMIRVDLGLNLPIE